MAVLWESTFDEAVGTGIRTIGAPFWSSPSVDTYEWETDGLGHLTRNSGQVNQYIVGRVAASADQKITFKVEVDDVDNRMPRIALRSSQDTQGNGYYLDYDGVGWDVAYNWSDKISIPDPDLLTVGNMREVAVSIIGDQLSLTVTDGEGNLIGEETVTESSKGDADSYFINFYCAYSASDYSQTPLYHWLRVEDSDAASATLPSAGFTASAGRVSPGADVTFTDITTNTPTSWLWDFGDGNTSSEQHPVHAYGASGDYVVTLTAANSDGSSSTSLSISVRNDWAISGTQTVDTPTNNYCTWNAMQQSSYPTHADYVYSAGNTVVSGTDSDLAFGTMWVKSGRWYWEFEVMDYISGHFYVGVAGNLTYNAYDGSAWVHQNLGGDNVSTPYGESYGDGDIIGVALDMDGMTCEFFKNGVSQGVIGFSIVPEAGMSPYAILSANNGGTLRLYSGSTGCVHTPPEGFLHLCAGNLPDPEIVKSSTGADIVLRQGTGQGVTVDTLDFQPDLVVVKNRTNTDGSWWQWYDAARGPNRLLASNDASDELVYPEGLQSFDVRGYTLGSNVGCDALGDSFLDMCLRADAITRYDEAGNVVSQELRGTRNGFEIVRYTGNGVAGRQIAHGLGKPPTFMVVKNISTSGGYWCVYHSALGATKYLHLESDDAAITGNVVWNDTEPTSTHFTVGASGGVNGNVGDEYIAYLFTDSDIFRSFSYRGNGSVDGPYVLLGGRPLAIPFIKNSEIAINWMNVDGVRSPFSPIAKILYPNLASPETDNGTVGNFAFTGNGFKVILNSSAVNETDDLIIGLAIVEAPQKYSNAF